jgi:hypothetical protein
MLLTRGIDSLLPGAISSSNAERILSRLYVPPVFSINVVGARNPSLRHEDFAAREVLLGVTVVVIAHRNNSL